MKKYIYNQASPSSLVDMAGEIFALQYGATITTCDGKEYNYYSHAFTLPPESLKSDFRRVYTVEEQNRYERIHDHAMVAAMQSMIVRLPDTISSDMHELENVTSNAIWFADNLVDKLKDKEY